MSLLNFDNSGNEPLRNRRNLKTILGIGALVGVIALGSTLAASLNLNSSSPVEFGQGVAQTTACDDEVIVTPYSTFANFGGAGSFMLSSITVREISSNCARKEFTLKAYGDSPGSELSLINGGATEIKILDAGSKFVIADTYGLSITSDGNTGFTLTFNNAAITAKSIYRITIESKKDSGAIQVIYELGEKGPGGGIVYYVSANYFTSTGSTCGTQCKYLEVAPATWQSAGVSVSDDSDYQWSDNTSTPTGQDSVTGTSESFYLYEHANWRIGQGFFNTSEMKVSGAISAAQAAVLAYTGGAAAGQWFIPSMNELNELCKYARGQTTGDPKVACDSSGTLKTGTADYLGGFMAHGYWSSSEGTADGAYVLNLADAYKQNNYKLDPYYVRPIRAF